MELSNTKQVRETANCLRRAMARGDIELAGDLLERKVLLAIVAQAASDLSRLIRTRTVDGDLAAKPIDEMLPDLQAKNYVGKSFASIEEETRKQIWEGVKAAATTLALPAWIGTIVGIFLNATGILYSAGSFVGWFAGPAIAVILGFGTYVLSQFLARVVAHSAASLSELAKSVLSIGSRAEVIFNAEAGAAYATYFRDPNLKPRLFTYRFRIALGSTLFVSYALLLVAVIAMIAGAFDGYQDYKRERARESLCGLTPNSSLCRSVGPANLLPSDTLGYAHTVSFYTSQAKQE